MQMLKVPRWIAARRENDDMDDDYTVPPVATLPSTNHVPEFSTHDEESMLVQRAAALHAQLKRSIETAQVELAESVLGRSGDQKKIALLELDIAQLLNDKQTLQTDLLEKDRCLSLLRQVLDKFGTKAPPKPERKPRPKKKANRESADPTAKADG